MKIGVEGEGQIGQVGFGMATQVVGHRLHRCLQALSALSAQHQELGIPKPMGRGRTVRGACRRSDRSSQHQFHLVSAGWGHGRMGRAGEGFGPASQDDLALPLTTVEKLGDE